MNVHLKVSFTISDGEIDIRTRKTKKQPLSYVYIKPERR